MIIKTIRTGFKLKSLQPDEDLNYFLHSLKYENKLVKLTKP